MTAVLHRVLSFRHGTGPNVVRVLGLGDRLLTDDALWRPDDAWLNRALERVAASDPDLTIEVAAQAGSSARLADLERDCRLVVQEQPDVVVVAIGSTDRSLLELRLWEPFLVLPLARYRRRVSQVLSRLRSTGAHVIVVGVGRSWHADGPPWARPHRLLQYASRATKSWYVDRALRRASGAHEAVTFLDVRARGSLDDRLRGHVASWRAPDGTHLNEVGHALLADGTEHLLRTVLTRRCSAAATLREDRSEIVAGPEEYRSLDLAAGRRRWPARTGTWRVRVRDTDLVVDREVGHRPRGHHGLPQRPVVAVIPDAPNVLEHHRPVFRGLRDDFRVVGFEMPGLGHAHAPGFDYRVRSGGQWILDVLERMQVRDAILAAGCVNGVWAIAAANIDASRNTGERRISALVLSQTPSLAELQSWGKTTIKWWLRTAVISDVALRIPVVRSAIARVWYGMSAPEDERARLLRLAEEGFATGAVWTLGALSRGILRSTPSDADPDQLDVPVEFVWGLGDRTHEAAKTDGTALLEMWKARGAEVHAAAGAGHCPDVVRPELIVSAVRRLHRQRADQPSALTSSN